MTRVESVANYFTCSRPVNKNDPCFETAVIGEPDQIELIGELNRFDPYLITGASAQGKSSFMYYLIELFNTELKGRFDGCWIKPDKRYFTSRMNLMEFLGLSLSSNPRSTDFEELLLSSKILYERSHRNISSLIYIDTSECDNSDVIEWIVHSIFLLQSELKDIVTRLRTLVMLSGNYDISILGIGPTAPYAMNQIILRNLSFEETNLLCDRVCHAASQIINLNIKSNAIERLYNETGGDKYYTNLLGMRSVLRAGNRPQYSNITVDENHVAEAADDIRLGFKCGDRVQAKMRLMFSYDHSLRSTIDDLIKNTPHSWEMLNTKTKVDLCRLGIVGPTISNGNELLGAFELIKRVRSDSINVKYTIRNGMIVDWLKYELDRRIQYLSSVRKTTSRNQNINDKWLMHNDRRLDLIDKEADIGLTREESTELERLQAIFIKQVNKNAPLPFEELDALRTKLELYLKGNDKIEDKP